MPHKNVELELRKKTEYIVQKIEEGKAIIALDGDIVAGFVTLNHGDMINMLELRFNCTRGVPRARLIKKNKAESV